MTTADLAVFRAAAGARWAVCNGMAGLDDLTRREVNTGAQAMRRVSQTPKFDAAVLSFLVADRRANAGVRSAINAGLGDLGVGSAGLGDLAGRPLPCQAIKRWPISASASTVRLCQKANDIIDWGTDKIGQIVDFGWAAIHKAISLTREGMDIAWNFTAGGLRIAKQAWQKLGGVGGLVRFLRVLVVEAAGTLFDVAKALVKILENIARGRIKQAAEGVVAMLNTLVLATIFGAGGVVFARGTGMTIPEYRSLLDRVARRNPTIVFQILSVAISIIVDGISAQGQAIARRVIGLARTIAPDVAKEFRAPQGVVIALDVLLSAVVLVLEDVGSTDDIGEVIALRVRRWAPGTDAASVQRMVSDMLDKIGRFDFKAALDIAQGLHDRVGGKVARLRGVVLSITAQARTTDGRTALAVEITTLRQREEVVAAIIRELRVRDPAALMTVLRREHVATQEDQETLARRGEEVGVREAALRAFGITKPDPNHAPVQNAIKRARAGDAQGARAILALLESRGTPKSARSAILARYKGSSREVLARLRAVITPPARPVITPPARRGTEPGRPGKPGRNGEVAPAQSSAGAAMSGKSKTGEAAQPRAGTGKWVLGGAAVAAGLLLVLNSASG